MLVDHHHWSVLHYTDKYHMQCMSDGLEILSRFADPDKFSLCIHGHGADV